jgi:hypothetical protein
MEGKMKGKVKYRRLKLGELIKSGDEFFSDGTPAPLAAKGTEEGKAEGEALSDVCRYSTSCTHGREGTCPLPKYITCLKPRAIPDEH